MVSYGEIGAQLETLAAFWEPALSELATVEASHGFGGHVEARYMLRHSLLRERDVVRVTLGVGYDKPQDSYVSYLYDVSTGSAPVNYTRTYDVFEARYVSSLVPVELGAMYRFPVTPRLGVVAAVLGGMAFGAVDEVMSQEGYFEVIDSGVRTESPISIETTIPYRAESAVVELGVGVEYLVKNWLSVGFRVGYRSCAMKLKSAANVDVNGDDKVDERDVRVGDYMTKRSPGVGSGRTDIPVRANFSGLNVRLELSLPL